MKHIFIVNPGAGQGMSVSSLEEKLKNLDIDYEIYETKAAKDATSYVRGRCESGEELRFYACGGDGTLKEVMEGTVGFANASITCYPVGSGNDFVKCFGGKERFFDLESLVKGEARPTDIIKVNDDFCINACHFGLDSAVAKTMSQVKRKKIIGGKNAYITGVVKAFICNMKTKGKIVADGEVLADGEFLLCAVSNGQYVGGMFKCAPKAAVDDGFLEVCLVKPVSRLTFIKLVKYYIEGSHIDNPRFKDILIYRKSKKVEVFAENGFTVSLDGELVETNHFAAEVEPGAVNFAVPAERVPAKV